MTVKVVDVVEQYFCDLLMPRNHGLIAITALAQGSYGGLRPNPVGFLVCMGSDPFLEVNFEDGSVILHVVYPPTIARLDPRTKEFVKGYGTFTPFSKKPKERHAAVQKLGTKRVQNGRTIKFDLYDPDSLGRAEFYVQTIITKVKYMVSRVHSIVVPKDEIEFVDLLDAAAIDYNKKVLRRR